MCIQQKYMYCDFEYSNIEVTLGSVGTPVEKSAGSLSSTLKFTLGLWIRYSEIIRKSVSKADRQLVIWGMVCMQCT